MIEIKENSLIMFQGKKYIIKQYIDIDTVLCIEEKTGIYKNIKIKDIDDECAVKPKIPIKPLESIDDKLLKIALKRLKIIKPLIEQNASSEDIEKKAKEGDGGCRATLYNWVKAYKNSNEDIRSLMPKYNKRGGKGKLRIDDTRKSIIYEIVNEYYISPQKPTISHTLEVINATLHKQGLKKISYATLRRIIMQIDERYLYEKREGRNKFLNHLKPSAEHFEATYPLEIVQIDHTPMDIQIVDETYRKPIGRPYITLAIDIFSRMIYGFCLTLDEPRLYSVGQTIYMGLLPKDNLLKEHGVDGEWNIYGIPVTIHSDNGNDFRSRGLEKFCEIMRINMDFRARRKPFHGGHIERMVKTMSIQIHNLKGTTFSNIQERGNYESEKRAVFTLKELEHYIVEWIVNYYHKKPHRGLDNISPEDKFKQGLLGSDNTPPIGIRILNTYEEKQFAKISLLPYEERTIQKTGVSMFGLKYFDEILIPFITPSKNTKKYIFRYDPKDMRKIYFYHPHMEEYVEIPNMKNFMPAVSKWEIDNARKVLKDARSRNYSEEKLLETVLRLREIEEASAKKTKAHRRQKENKKVTVPITHRDKKENKTAEKPKIKIKKFKVEFE